MPIYWESKHYSREQFISAWESSASVSEVLRKLGYAQGGGSYRTAYMAASELNLTSDHMSGKAHMKGKIPTNARPLSELLVVDSPAGKIKSRLLKEGILEAKCSVCLITHWNGELAPLELDHIDGNNRNNLIENLRIICPNCHAQTDTYKGKNIAKRRNKTLSFNAFCIDCETPIVSKRAKRCLPCSRKRSQKITWPDVEKIRSLVDTHGYAYVGRSLGVSDNAIRKHLRNAP